MVRSRALVTLVAVGALVGACNSAASSGPGSSTGASGPAATEAGGPAASQSGGGPGASQDITAGEAFGPAASALDALDSYKFDVEISSSSTSAVGSEGTTSFTGTVIHKPSAAQQLDEVVKDASGNVTSEFHVLIIGSQAWMKETADGKYAEVPGATATGMIASFAAFQPEKLFGTLFGTLGSDYHLVGTETKNGVNAQHFHGDESIGSVLSALSGTSGTWTSDVWLAVDGGFLVSSNATAAAATATAAGNFSIDVEITNVNDPANQLQPPS